MRILIVGCGYVGLPLGRVLAQAGHTVFGLRRSRSAEAELQAAGIAPVWADITAPGGLDRLPAPFDWVVNCAASGGGGLDEYRRIYLDGTRNLVSRLMAAADSGAGVARYVYTSSTSVYGQNDASWVTEASATEPAAETGRILLEVERFLLETHRAAVFPAMILRLAGIYGPGRGYWLKQFLSGQARLEGDGCRFLNMIHRDDVVGAVVAALERGVAGEVYNVVDDEPVAQKDLLGWLAGRLGRPMPEAVPPDPQARKRGVTDKRVSNLKLKRALDYRLGFPTFREGFEMLLNSST